MATTPQTLTISVFTRHNEDCAYKDNPQAKRCKCRKYVYQYIDGKVKYTSAKTRSWEQAEKFAQSLRDEHDPVKQELARIAAEEAAKKAKLKAHAIEPSLKQWSARFTGDGKAAATKQSYVYFTQFLTEWAASQGFSALSDITPAALDAWVTSWNGSPHTRANRLSRLRSFFKWASDLRLIESNPAAVLLSIKAENEEETQPLTKEQFKQLLEATYKYDADRRSDKDKFGADLRAVLLVMRWTGVRLSDALMLRRSGVVGDRLKMDIQKTGDKIDRVVPSVVIDALAAVPVRKRMHPDQFFWSRECDHRTLAGMWTPRIRLLNQYLNFKNERGDAMQFHSHMLRDTFAVELLIAGMPLENVSKLLCHSSVRITEQHYAPWVTARMQRLEDEMKAAMRGMGVSFDGD